MRRSSNIDNVILQARFNTGSLAVMPEVVGHFQLVETPELDMSVLKLSPTFWRESKLPWRTLIHESYGINHAQLATTSPHIS